MNLRNESQEQGFSLRTLNTVYNSKERSGKSYFKILKIKSVYASVADPGSGIFFTTVYGTDPIYFFQT
jgi:hypothetical protein